MHELPKLDYAYDALEPYIDAKTMEIHHLKHHVTYVQKLGEGVKGTKFETMDVDDILKVFESIPKELQRLVRNHGGGHSNHRMFWKMMAPKAGGEPKGKLAEAIKKQFGSFASFKEQFSKAALDHFGSGWAWLVLGKDKFEILSTLNQDSPLMFGKTPILALDVWEHSYYILRQNRRAEYITAWWNVVNWKEAEKRFQ